MIPNPAIPAPRVKQLESRIVQLSHLTHDTVELVVATESDAPEIYSTAGQFCTLRPMELDRPRAYSLARAPDAEQPGEYTFLIRLVPDGEFSQWLRLHARVGNRVMLGGPLGQFSLPATRAMESTIVCVAGGSGMSAMFSILEAAKIDGVPRDCYFFYGARTQADLCKLDEIDDIQRHWHRDYDFEFTPVLSDEPGNSDWRGARGLVVDAASTILSAKPTMDFASATYLFCGPPIMVDLGVQKFCDLGAPRAHCHFDRFEDVSSPAPTIDNKRCVLCDECLLVKPIADCIVESYDVASSTPAATRIEPLRSSGLYYNGLVVSESHCIRCHACIDACPHDAIRIGTPSETISLRENKT